MLRKIKDFPQEHPKHRQLVYRYTIYLHLRFQS